MGKIDSRRPRARAFLAWTPRRALSIGVAMLASTLLLQNAHASKVSYSHDFSLNSPAENFSINQFDPTLGYLNGVEIALSGSGGVETVVASVGPQSTFNSLGSSVTGGLGGPNGVNLSFSATKLGTVSGTFGNVGYAKGVPVTTTTSSSTASTTVAGAGLAAYIGPGTVKVPVSVSAHVSTSMSQGQLVSATDSVEGLVTFAYHYATMDGLHPTVTFTSSLSTSSDSSFDISKFDSGLGTLTSVDVTFSTSQTVAGKVAGSGLIGFPTAFAVDAASVTLGLPNGLMLMALPTLPPAYQGNLTLDATSAQPMGGSPVDVNVSQTLLGLADMANFIGSGTVAFSLFDSPGLTGYVGDGLFAGTTFSLDGSVEVTYDYSQTPPFPPNVPEPSMLSLLAAGIFGMVIFRRRPGASQV